MEPRGRGRKEPGPLGRHLGSQGSPPCRAGALTSVPPAGWQLVQARLRLGVLLRPGLPDRHRGSRLLNKLLQITLPQLLI